MRLWPHGDEKIPGLRAGIIASAPAVFAKYGITSPVPVAHASYGYGAGTVIPRPSAITHGSLLCCAS
jgi:hypothetical protein